MIIPEDWDRPDIENDSLCSRFQYTSYSKDGVTVPCRLYRAENRKNAPLVVFLHGADAVGSDNEKQLSIHDIGTMFAGDYWQKLHPCHIIAPQYDRGMHWSTDQMDELIDAMVVDFAGELGADSDRIYIYGYSAGGVGALRYIKEHPKRYAGAIAICGATSVEHIDALRHTPLWMIHAADDSIVKATYRDPKIKELYHYGSQDIYELLGHESNNMKYTRLPKGYMMERYGVNPHCSWVEVSNSKNTIYGEWLLTRRS